MAVGDFNYAPNSQPMRHIARWNPQAGTWEEFGGGTSRDVLAATTIGRDLIVGGDFNSVGENPRVPVSCIARWDGTQDQWTAVGYSDGINAPVYMLDVRGGELFAGSNFGIISGHQATGIARFDGKQWQPFGEPLI